MSGRYLLPFISNTRKSFFCVAVEKENHRSFLFFQCSLPKTRLQEILVPALETRALAARQCTAMMPYSPKTYSTAKGVTLDNFASCPNRPIRSPKIKEIRRLSNIE